MKRSADHKRHVAPSSEIFAELPHNLRYYYLFEFPPWQRANYCSNAKLIDSSLSWQDASALNSNSLFRELAAVGKRSATPADDFQQMGNVSCFVADYLAPTWRNSEANVAVKRETKSSRLVVNLADALGEIREEAFCSRITRHCNIFVPFALFALIRCRTHFDNAN